MKIVILDGYTLNPGDLDWKGFEALGEVQCFDRSKPEEIPDHAKSAEALITNKAPITRETIQQLPQLRYIGVSATGYNIVDAEAASEQEIVVTNVPNYGTAAVAQHAVSLLLELTNRVGSNNGTVQQGGWANNPDWCCWNYPIVELADKTLGIIGFGQIGQKLAAIAAAFGMKVIAHHKHPKRDAREGVSFVGLEQLFRESDVISLHCPLTSENAGMIDKTNLSLMKQSAFLINTARGGLVNEADLAEFLKDGKIAGAGLDVLSQEPPPQDHPLVGIPNCIITPHNAWAAKASRARLMALTVENLKAFLQGAPKNVVNGA